MAFGACWISQALLTSLPSFLFHVSHSTSISSSDQPDTLCPTVSQLADRSATGGAGGGGGAGRGGGSGGGGGGGCGVEEVVVVEMVMEEVVVVVS